MHHINKRITKASVLVIPQYNTQLYIIVLIVSYLL